MDENTSDVSLEEIQHWNVRALKDFLRIRGLKTSVRKSESPTHKYDYELVLFFVYLQKAVGKTLLRMRSHNSEKAYCHVHDIGFQYTMPHTALCVYA